MTKRPDVTALATNREKSWNGALHMLKKMGRQHAGRKSKSEVVALD